MVAVELMDTLAAKGISLRPGNGVLRAEPASLLTDSDRHAIRAEKSELLYRLLLREWFRLTCLEADGTPCLLDEAAGLLNEEWQIARQLGGPRTDQIRQNEYQRFFATTHRCPTCGEREVFHPQADSA